jgi:uncharacterized cupredoxin-like copper-binding protein
MRATQRRDLGQFLGAAAVIVVLTVGSTLTLAAASGGLTTHRARQSTTSQPTSCATPALPGTTVDVTLSDMSAMMRGGQRGRRTWQQGMMRVTANPSTAPHGTVSLRVTNFGVITHELLVLPLPAGQATGARPVGQDGKVAETGSLGEVSRNCADGAGDGIAPGASSWTTLTLPAGRYELVCNLPGHYAAGMYTELDVT